MKIQFITIAILLFITIGFPQDVFQMGFWKHTSLHGSVQMEGLYRSQETTLRSGEKEQPKTTLFTGNLNVNSRSYIWHPNFLKLNIDAEYNPAVRNQKYIVVPNRSETRTAEQARIATTFFDQRPLSFNTYYNLSHLFINRELTTNVETYQNEFGAGLSYRNPYLPVSLRYLNSQWDQNELETGRKYENNRKNFKVETSKSFTRHDDHRLTYINDDYTRIYAGNNRIHNKTSSARLQDNFSFNNGKQNYWRSLIWYQDQSGTFPLNRFQVDENARVSLPANLSTSGFYRYARFEQQSHINRQHNILGRLEHQLFKSLNSYTSYEFIHFKNTVYDEDIHQGAAGFRYTKEIPTGRLNVSYEYRLRSDDRNSRPDLLRVFDEAITLSDGQIVLLANADVDLNTILVTDESSTIIYQENIDYLVIQRGNFVEIQRLPAGQIGPDQMVLVDYTSTQNTSYDFNTGSNSFQFGLNVFDRLFEFYFRYYDQDYSNVNLNEQRILKTISQRIIGVRSSRGFLSAGFEMEDYNSNLLPYEARRIFISANKHFRSGLNMYISANYRDYHLIRESETQNFYDVTGRLNYQLNRNNKISLDGGYRFQEGRGIDLDLTTMRTEYSTRYRLMYLHIGLEIYRRDFSGEKINYNGGYIRLERKF